MCSMPDLEYLVQKEHDPKRVLEFSYGFQLSSRIFLTQVSRSARPFQLEFHLKKIGPLLVYCEDIF